jgi:hypothetical protein
MVDVLGLRLLLFDKSGYVDGNVMSEVFLGHFFGDHDESKECQTRTSRDILDKVVTDVDYQLIGGKNLCQNRVPPHRGLYFLVDFIQGADLVLELLAFLGFLCFCQLIYQLYGTFTMIIELGGSCLLCLALRLVISRLVHQIIIDCFVSEIFVRAIAKS